MKIPLISSTRWCKLPTRWRIAVGASLVQEVVAHYSPYFRERFRVDVTLRAAWRFACGRTVSADRLAALRRQLTRLLDEYAESSGYSFEQIFMAGYLLEEIVDPDGRGIAGAVDATAIGFSYARLYECNLSGWKIGVDVIDDLGMPVYRAAKKRYSSAHMRPVSEITRSVFRDAPIEVTQSPAAVTAAIKAQAKRRTKYWDLYLPPIHERARTRKITRKQGTTT